MPAATADLQALSSKLIKSRHCLHATNLKVESIRNECDKARASVEANDAEIQKMIEEEAELKRRYVESKLTYEKAHAEKYARQQTLKQMRQQKVLHPTATHVLQMIAIGCTQLNSVHRV